MVSVTENPSKPVVKTEVKPSTPASARRKSLRRLPQSFLEKLSNSTDHHLDSDFITGEIRRRLTYRSSSAGIRRMSILSQTGSYKINSSGKNKDEPVEQVQLTRRKSTSSEDEGTDDELRPTQGPCTGYSLHKTPDEVPKSKHKPKCPKSLPTMATRSRTKSSNKATWTGATPKGRKVSRRNSGSSSKTRRSVRKINEGRSPANSTPRLKTAREPYALRNTMSVNRNKSVNLDFNGTLKNLFTPQSSGKQRRKNIERSALFSNTFHESYTDADENPRRMSFDEYQLLEHKKKLEKDLVFKAYKEKRAEFIRSEKAAN